MKNQTLNYGFIAISGADAANFLQGQLTCDVKKIDEQHSSFGAYCNLQGRVEASFRLFYAEENYYLCLPNNMVERTINLLKKYAVFSKITITDASEYLCALGTINQDPTQLKSLTSWQEYGDIDRYIFIVKAGDHSLINSNAIVSNESWKLLNIHAGIATIYPATAGKFTPHVLNYPALGAVSFQKGCYLGQEIVARTEYRGNVKQHVHSALLKANTLPQIGEELTAISGGIMGTVLEAAFDNEQQARLLIVMADEIVAKKNIMTTCGELVIQDNFI